jgi:hypothetical protein
MNMIGLKKGQSLVEFAIILPIVVILVIGVIDFGRYMLAYSTLNTAVREGTRMAVVGDNYSDIAARINVVCSNLKGFNCATNCTPYDAGTLTDPKKGIIIQYNFIPIIPGFTFPIRVQSEMLLAPLYK